MAQQPPDEKPKITLKSEKRKEAGTGGVRQYQTPIAILIGVVVIVGAILLTRPPQTPQEDPQATAILPSNTPVEVGTIQALETEKALLVTPSIDPNLLALQTQNALLAQGATDQAATNQAIALIPTQTAFVVTSVPLVTVAPPQIITATPLPQVAQPTQVGIITAPAEGQTACLTFSDLEKLGRVLEEVYGGGGDLAGAKITFTKNWIAPNGWVIHKNNQVVSSVSTGDVATVWSADYCRPLKRTSGQYPLAGSSFDAFVGTAIDRAYNAVWTESGRLYQPSIPAGSQRKAHNVAIKIMPGRYTFNGIECAFYLDTARNGQGSQNPLVASYGNDIPITVNTVDGLEAWGLVECRGGQSSGFEVLYGG
jgi:hypothetical protein